MRILRFLLKPYKIICILTILSTIISLIIFVIPFISFIFNEALRNKINASVDGGVYLKFSLALTMVLNIYLLFQNYLLQNDKSKDNAIIKQIKMYLELLCKFYGWKSGYRVTLFLPTKTKAGQQCLKAIDRIAYGHDPGLDNSDRLIFGRNQGMPGLAWENAWDGEHYKDLIDVIQVKHLDDKLLNYNDLEVYFKREFNIDESLFNQLSEEKLKIRSYLSIGIIGMHSKIAAVIVVDSTSPDAFRDFEMMKIFNEGKIQLGEIKIAHEASIQKLPKKDNIEKLTTLKSNEEEQTFEIDINKEKLHEISRELRKDNNSESMLALAEMFSIDSKRVESIVELDKELLIFSIILKELKGLLESSSNLEELYANC